jgi:putative transposase
MVMPNHIHGILIVGAQFTAPSSVLHDDDNRKRGATNRAPTLGEIVPSYKAASIRMVRPNLEWPRNYYKPIIRDDDSLHRIRQYIQDNPRRWDLDHENPAATNPSRKMHGATHNSGCRATNVNLP